ncbi:PREDICTED: putative fatty acyl-CoA reductase CG5065 [Drosophila arizonae]|uniref:Fatty acyl-CoA reductase n=1 Tax=Drosophila arizonae TaxID=7263 RepID=A0ABM1NKN9_DROAR|nr:PREDICTED: putative fatty acyl-CoA reductase CG5065 [Drosophila arizonae]
MDSEYEMTSEIQNFYRNKTVFITGGSGFLGKVVIEKLLRATDVKRIYVLIRAKRGEGILQRLAKWKDEGVFALLLKSKPSCWARIVPIAGDCQQADLGLSEADRQLLMEEVQVVVHSAATVRFMEPLHVALDINTRTTRLMLQLAKQMKRLETFVHISTAYSNCVIKRIGECYYPEHLTCSVGTILALRERLSDELIDGMAPVLSGKFPNTYTYTKALAEQLVQTEAAGLPICIVRPGIIIGSYKEPVSGWVDNLYGPISIFLGTAIGVLRIICLNLQTHAHLVPVDYCSNLILACAWQTAKDTAARLQEPIAAAASTTEQCPPTIYNYVPSESNMLSWGSIKSKAESLGYVYPLSRMIWLPFLHTTTTPWLFKLAAFFYHILPGYCIDVVLRLRGRTPRMLKLYEKIHKNVETLFPFTNSNWYFESHNTQKLWQRLSPEDQQLFHFDMNTMDWDDYLYIAIAGMRIFVAKEEPESVERGKKKLKRFYILHRALQFIVCSGAAAILWSLLKFVF